MDANEILRAAMRLPSKERERLARNLLESLDGPPDADAESAWVAEIEKRAAELDEGSIAPVDWETARARIAASLRLAKLGGTERHLAAPPRRRTGR